MVSECEVKRGGDAPADIFVVNGDSFEVAKAQDCGFRPAVMNMANENHPGGGYKRGARAKPGHMRRICIVALTYSPTWLDNLDLVPRAKPWSYPIPEMHGSGAALLIDFDLTGSCQ